MVASTRPCCSSATACAQPSTASTVAPLSCASSYQLLVSDWAVVLPSRSSKLEIESSSSATTMTPGETVYGSLKRYFSSRSGLIETWLAMTSKRPASRPGEDRVPLRLLEDDLEAELVGDGLGDLDVEADEVAGLVVEGEGPVRALGRDRQRARRHEAVVVAGGRLGRFGGAAAAARREGCERRWRRGRWRR